eukprot:1157261-Pelagomonas_calceolata.AAC.1
MPCSTYRALNNPKWTPESEIPARLIMAVSRFCTKTCTGRAKQWRSRNRLPSELDCWKAIPDFKRVDLQGENANFGREESFVACHQSTRRSCWS